MKSINGHRILLGGLIVGRVEVLPAGQFINVRKISAKLKLDLDWVEERTRKESLFPFSYFEYHEGFLIPIEEYPAWLVSVLEIDDLPLNYQHHAHIAVMNACRELMKTSNCHYQTLHLVERYFQSAELSNASVPV